MAIKIRYGIILLMLSLFIFGLFQVKFKVQSLHKELAELKKQLEHEKDSIHVLQAEWTYLNKPERLQALAEKLLNLAEIKSEQIILANSGDVNVSQVDTNNTKTVDEKFIKASMITPVRRSQTKWRYKERPDLIARRKK